MTTFKSNIKSTKYLIYFTIILIAADLCFGVLGYHYIESISFRESFYMTMITISTVGFGEVVPLSPAGQNFTIALIVLNFGVVAYSLSVFSYLIIQGELFNFIFQKKMEKDIKQLNNHIILCGFGKYGRQIIINLKNHHEEFIVIDKDGEKLKFFNEQGDKDLYIEGDATLDEILMRAGILKAKAVISALPRDTDNLFVVLTSRQLAPNINIISKVVNQSAETKLKLAGANHTILPEQIGGYYMATLTSKPNSIEFFSFITRDVDSDIDFGELSYDAMPDKCKGKSIAELNLRKETGVNVIGYKDTDGSFHVNPIPKTYLKEGTSFIVIGTQDQILQLNIFIGNMA